MKKCGILMHISSLYSKYGIGTLGKSAYEFVDLLNEAGESFWQVLPICPTGYGDSPYQSCDSNAGNPYFIDFDLLKEQKLIKDSDLSAFKKINNAKVDYGFQYENRFKVLKIAFSNFNKENVDFVKFVKKGYYDNYSLFMSLKISFNMKCWSEWNDEYKFRDEKAIKEYKERFKDDILFWQWVQFEFWREWKNLKNYCREKKVKLIGDAPLYVSYDSVDVWSNPNMFLLDENLVPTVVAGVPPDYFSNDGQLWGNPIYNWSVMKGDDFIWWKKRFKLLIDNFDYIRLDHFRGLAGYYTIKYGQPNAKEGEWVDGIKNDFIDSIKKRFKNIKIIAEDLGTIDDDVRNLVKYSNFPGMKVALFGFNGDKENEHLPRNIEENVVYYTGTHDNSTIKGYIKSLDAKGRAELKKMILEQNEEFKCDFSTKTIDDMVDAIIKLCLASKSKLVIIPMQDILKEDDKSRMNTPSSLGSNWSYRVRKNQFNDKLKTDLSTYRLKSLR